MDICSEDIAKGKVYDYKGLCVYCQLVTYCLRLTMGLVTLAYLISTKKNRTFPGFVKTQLALIVTEYIIAVGEESLIVVHTKPSHFNEYP